MRRSFYLITFLATLSVATAQGSNMHNYKPAQGYVHDAETAIRLAIAVWEPIYGRERIAQQKPYTATLTNGVWVVEGSLPKEHARGGTAIAEIS